MSAPGSSPARRVGLGLLSIITAAAAAACAPRQVRSLRQASDDLGRSVSRGDAQEVREHVVAGSRAQIDAEAMVADGSRRAWAKALDDPREAIPEAVIFLAPDQPVRAVWTEEGWRFAEDPTNVYAQSTPRQALRALVRATRASRWDIVLRLAPRRYRLGLSEKDLQSAWSEGEQAAALWERLDRLADHLVDPIVADADEAALDMGQGHVARLEREGDRWVVVEF